MNTLQWIGSVLALSSTVACRPIGPPETRRPPPIRASATTQASQPNGEVPSAATAASIPASPQATPPVQSPAPDQPTTKANPAPRPTLPQASKPATPKDPYLTAQKAPNKPGYALSPHTGKLVLIDGIPSGVVVPDQTCPPGEKKFFRVP